MNPLLMIQGDMADVQTVVDTAAAVAAPERITLWQMALNGGWIMIVLAILLALAIYISVERYLALRQALNAENDNLFMNSIREYIHKGDVDAARSLSKKTNSPLARMVDKGLSRLGRPLSDIQATIENEGKLEVARLEKRVSLVATVASLGPMIGFLGTVTGMVTCFQDMAHAGNNIEINTLATGMYQPWSPLSVVLSSASSATSSTMCLSPASTKWCLTSKCVPLSSWISSTNPHNIT